MDYDSSKDDDEGNSYEGDEIEQDDNDAQDWKIINANSLLHERSSGSYAISNLKDNSSRRTSIRQKRKSVFGQDEDSEGEDDSKSLKRRRRSRDPTFDPSEDAAFFPSASSPTVGIRRKKSSSRGKKKKHHSSDKKSKKRRKADASSDDEIELVIDDPNSYYDTDEYDSDGRLIKRDEIKKKQREEERLQRKEKRKPNIPHLIKYYTPVPMDPFGKPILPIALKGGLTVLSLGNIVTDRPKFHAKRYIWPVGFKSTRIYSSMTILDKKVQYTSEIVDRGEEPGFVVTCYENENQPIVIERNTASGAWAEVAKKYFEMRKELTGKEILTQLSGPEMFGYAHPTIAKLIQEMPGADQCKLYQPQQFVPISAKNKTSTDSGKKGRRKRKTASSDESDSSESDFSMSSEEEDSSDDVKPQKKIETTSRPIRVTVKPVEPMKQVPIQKPELSIKVKIPVSNPDLQEHEKSPQIQKQIPWIHGNTPLISMKENQFQDISRSPKNSIKIINPISVTTESPTSHKTLLSMEHSLPGISALLQNPKPKPIPIPIPTTVPINIQRITVAPPKPVIQKVPLQVNEDFVEEEVVEESGNIK